MTEFESIGGYRVLSLLGEGGMGRVYRAHDAGLARDVAIKVLRKELAQDEEASGRFLREARAAARLVHPRVVQVFQVGEEGGAPFLVLELVEGEDLAERLKREGPLPIKDALAVIADAAEGLKAADEVGLVHRDVKPGNLISDGARVKLSDFGLARPIDGSSDVTQTGIVVGTPAYVAPEVARGREATRQSDIYALGCTLFELLTGRHPFEGETVLEVVAAQLNDAPPSLSEFRPDAPLVLAELLDRMLAKDPAARPQGYDALTLQLQAAQKAPASVPAAPSTTTSSGELKTSGRFSSVKSETRTVMFTDIVGYSERTGAQSREEAARWLELHDALLRPVLKAFGGQLVKTIGDAFLVTFRSPTDAVLCGTAIQDRLAQHNKTASAEERIRVRVAISSGEVRLHKGDVLGETVNIAARLESLAEPGEVVLSDAVFATMNAAEVPLDERGAHDLKGISRKVTVYAVRRQPEDGMPYGGRTLPDDLDRVDAAMLLKGAADQVARGAETAVRRLGIPTRWVAALGGLVVVSFLLMWAISSSGDARIDRIDAGQSAAVVAELEKIKRTPDDELIYGHALFALEKHGAALRAYEKAAAGDARDERMLENLFAHLEDPKSSKAVALLGDWPDNIDGGLERMLTHDDWNKRHAAASALDRRKSEYDKEALGILDLDTAKTCQGRQRGLRTLKKHGKSERALELVQAASKDMPSNLCMILEFGGAESAIKSRR